MNSFAESKPYGNRSFLASPPFENSKVIARQFGCDVAVPNGLGTGIGNVLMFTPLIEALALKLGRRLKILTAPLMPKVGTVDFELPFPIWTPNPYIKDILDISSEDANLVQIINDEKDNCCQFNHIIENICFQYGVRPRALRPQIFLTTDEQTWALDQLSNLQRPLVALHPAGKTAPRNPAAWGAQRWCEIIENCPDFGFIQIGKRLSCEPDLGITKFDTTLREAFALIWASDAFVGFDSSPMHVATAFKKPVLALWDAANKLRAEESWQQGFSPAVMLRWGYPQNRNLMILGERDHELVELTLTWLHDTLQPICHPYFMANNAGAPFR